MKRARTIVAAGALLAATVALTNSAVRAAAHPDVTNCTKMYAMQFLDHFGWRTETFQERVFVYDKWFTPGQGPIFFYTGNEADVTLFANLTGLMWENAQEFGALVVFAEHRFFGDSLPCEGGFQQCGDYLSTDQAMADYASLIESLYARYNATSTVVFGGSYGGMLAAWMRMRYPALVDGAIASSAPIGCLNDTYKGESYWAVVSRDATAAGGSAPQCAQNVNSILKTAMDMIASGDVAQQQAVQKAFQLCELPQDANAFGYFIQAAFDSMAMGDYPYPTYYISGTPQFPAPAWPMRQACENLATLEATPAAQMGQLFRAINTVNNLTLDVPCYHTSLLNPSVYSPIWDFMVCTEHIINEQPYFAATGWPNDMFYAQPVYDKQRLDDHCMLTFGRVPRWDHLNTNLGVTSIPDSSNIVFANGLLDPWHSGGILQNVSDTILAYHVPEGGHHLDLFFSNPADPESVRWIRRRQLENIRRWTNEGSQKSRKVSAEAAKRLSAAAKEEAAAPKKARKLVITKKH
jgi:lysosomal Pro-X carboxypeptidase